MAFPKINHCIVCDDVRLEPGGKASILGFYGIVPDVELGIADFTKPVPKLCFMFIGGQSSGTSHVEFSASGAALEAESSVNADIPIEQGSKRAVFVFAISPVKFRAPGECRVTLRADGEIRYNQVFAVVQGKAVTLQ